MIPATQMLESDRKKQLHAECSPLSQGDMLGLGASKSEPQPAQDERAAASTFVCMCSYALLLYLKALGLALQ